MSSTVLVQTKGWQRSFQPVTKARILAFRSRTEPEVPRWMGLAFDDPEPDLDQVQPRSRDGREVGRNPWIGGEPVPDLAPFVGGVVVHHQMQLLVGVGAGDLFQECQELLVAVPTPSWVATVVRVMFLARRAGRRSDLSCLFSIGGLLT
jgi:hypothetical protein